jgi:hypothetical protein
VRTKTRFRKSAQEYKHTVGVTGLACCRGLNFSKTNTQWEIDQIWHAIFLQVTFVPAIQHKNWQYEDISSFTEIEVGRFSFAVFSPFTVHCRAMTNDADSN